MYDFLRHTKCHRKDDGRRSARASRAKTYTRQIGGSQFWGPLLFTPPPCSGPKPFPEEKPGCTSGFDFSVERTRLSVLLHAPSSRSRGGQPRHVCPARAPRDHALPLRLPGAERATGVLPQLANRGVRRGVQLQRPPHHRAVRDGDDDALPNAATGCEAQAMEEHAAEDIKHIPPTTVRLPAARSLPLGLADGGHAALRGRAGRTLTWSASTGS